METRRKRQISSRCLLPSLLVALQFGNRENSQLQLIQFRNYPISIEIETILAKSKAQFVTMKSAAFLVLLYVNAVCAFSLNSQPRVRSSSHASLSQNMPKVDSHNILFSTSAAVGEDKDFDWKSYAKSLFTEDKRPIILFDGVCSLCNGGVNFAIDHDSVGKFRFASLQSKAGQTLLMRSGKKPNDISSIVLVTPDKAYFKSDAVLRIAQKLDGNPLLPVVGTVGPFVPGFIRNKVYDVVADNRYRFGEADQCRMDFDNEFGSRFVTDDDEL